MFESNNSIEGFLQPGGAGSGINGGVFDSQSATNGPMPFMGMFGTGVPDLGGGMNLDWVSGSPTHAILSKTR